MYVIIVPATEAPIPPVLPIEGASSVPTFGQAPQAPVDPSLPTPAPPMVPFMSTPAPPEVPSFSTPAPPAVPTLSTPPPTVTQVPPVQPSNGPSSFNQSGFNVFPTLYCVCPVTDSHHKNVFQLSW